MDKIFGLISVFLKIKTIAFINELKEQLFFKKFNSPLGFITLIICSLLIAFFLSKVGLILGSVLFVGIIGGSITLLCLFVPKFGFFLVIILSFFVFFLERFLAMDLPRGVLIQFFVSLSTIAIFIKKLNQRDKSFSFLNNSLTYAYIVFFIYMLIQVFNPNMDSFDGWVQSIKGTITVLAPFFITLYLFKNLKFLERFIKVWLFLAVMVGLYSCYQEWFGLPDFEERWIRADIMRYRRIFVEGRFRKYSLLSDPAACGIFLASSGIFSLVLASGPFKLKKKFLLFVSAIILFLGMSYTGTRTSFAMVPGGIVLFGLLTITNKRTLIFSVILAFSFAFVLFGPIYGNATVNRMRSAFNTEDASLNVRDVNRAKIQPYIHEHPMGGGVMTSGTVGLKFNPEHRLAGFPPDSGYLKIAMERGWIGLIIACSILFLILRVGIRNYYRSKNLLIRSYYAAFLSFFFAIVISLYAQTVTGQIPMALIFYPSVAIIAKLKDFNSIT